MCMLNSWTFESPQTRKRWLPPQYPNDWSYCKYLWKDFWESPPWQSTHKIHTLSWSVSSHITQHLLLWWWRSCRWWCSDWARPEPQIATNCFWKAVLISHFQNGGTRENESAQMCRDAEAAGTDSRSVAVFFFFLLFFFYGEIEPTGVNGQTVRQRSSEEGWCRRKGDGPLWRGQINQQLYCTGCWE